MSEAKMQRPQWKHEVNLNTVLLALTILGSGVGWGMNWQAQVAAQKRADERIDQAMVEIARVNAEVRAAIGDIQQSMRTYADLPYRVTALETQFAALTTTQRDLERALTQLASDMRVTREIVERLDPARRSTR